jgi:hypothetical protein
MTCWQERILAIADVDGGSEVLLMMPSPRPLRQYGDLSRVSTASAQSPLLAETQINPGLFREDVRSHLT